MLETPVLFLIFNRYEDTKSVFDEIRKQAPRNLFIGADGPRPECPEDEAACNSCRGLVLNGIDWDCQVHTRFGDKNAGCGVAVSEAIDWFFTQVEEGIILEDDCLPDASFFEFCTRLLEKHRNDPSVMHISGANLNDRNRFGEGTYYYSRYANIWGWATWRRAWKNYDFDLSDEDVYIQAINHSFRTVSERRFWLSRLELIRIHHMDTWDYQWMFTIIKTGGFCLNPNYNLVTNIGFNDKATHTHGKNPYIVKETRPMGTWRDPSERKIFNRAERQYLWLVHGLKRRNNLHDYLHTRGIQRFLNLIHKMRITGK